MKTKILVLLSGGQDSTTCLFWAKHKLGHSLWPETMPAEIGLRGEVELHALTVKYGQRHVAEVEAAHEIAIAAGCASHVSVVFAPLFVDSMSALIGDDHELKGDGGMADKAMPEGLPTSFVPGRNLLFLAAAVARAGAIGASHIVTGVCQTDYSGYPDCREEFVLAMQAATNQAWPSGVDAPRIHTPLMRMTKAQTVELARDLPGCMEALALSITCYQGRRPGCDECPACVLRRKGFADAMVADPAVTRWNRISGELT